MSKRIHRINRNTIFWRIYIQTTILSPSVCFSAAMQFVWFVGELQHGGNTVVQLWQRHCVDAKWLQLRLEKHCFSNRLVACLRPNKKTFFRACLFHKRAPADGERQRNEVKVQRNTTLSKAFLRHFNSFVISACQTWLEQRIIAPCTQATQVKSISFDAARGLLPVFLGFFFFSSLLQSPPLRLDITLQLSRQPCNMTDLMTEER